MYTLVFDIETIPDITAGSKLYGFSGDDAQIAEAMFAKRREETQGSDFLRLHLQKIVTISVVLSKGEQVKVWSLGHSGQSEAELIKKFYDLVEQCVPTLVSWNGSGFDMPVLHYRALINKVVANRYWESGEHDSGFKWNNYLNRYHYRHLDLMDVLACYQAKANAPLDEIASLLGFPGKMGMAGNKVWEYYLNGKLNDINDYCETDVLNTYLVYLQFEYMRGFLDAKQLKLKKESLHQYLQQENKKHFNEFLTAWSFE